MPRAADRRTRALRSSFVLRADTDGLHISVGRCFDMHLGLRLRADEVQRCIYRVFGRGSRWDPQLKELTCAAAPSPEVESRLDSLAEALARIAWRPLTPRLVAAALGISAQERVRWTKDGRLPRSGQAFARRGALLSVPTYAVALIEDLAAHPEKVAAWREQEAALARARA
jgi:hypothetical protein